MDHLLRGATDLEYSKAEREGLRAINVIISEAHNRQHKAFVMAAAGREADIANLVCHSRCTSRGTSSCHTADSTIATSDDLPDNLQRGERTGASAPPSNEEHLFNGLPLWGPFHADWGDYSANGFRGPLLSTRVQSLFQILQDGRRAHGNLRLHSRQVNHSNLSLFSI